MRRPRTLGILDMVKSPLTMTKQLLMKQEGLRLKPYRDTMGKLTIGYGRNLDDKGITEAEAEHLLANDIVECWKALRRELPWVLELDFTRQLAMLSMAFNLGIGGLLTFKGMLRHLKAKNFAMAAVEALDSDWHLQVGKRAEEIANMIETGELPDYVTG